MLGVGAGVVSEAAEWGRSVRAVRIDGHTMKTLLSRFGLICAIAMLGIFAVTGPMMVRGWWKLRALNLTFPAYTQALLPRDYKTAYAFGSSEFGKATSYEEFVKALGTAQERLGDLKSVKQGRTIVNGEGSTPGWVGRITADQTYARGQVGLLYEFHWENNRWSLFGFKELRVRQVSTLATCNFRRASVPSENVL